MAKRANVSDSQTLEIPVYMTLKRLKYMCTCISKSGIISITKFKSTNKPHCRMHFKDVEYIVDIGTRIQLTCKY